MNSINTTPAAPDQGLILFGHGARDPRWADTLHAIAERCRGRSPQLAVSCAFLEFMTPDLGQAIDDMAARGVTRLLVAPVFLAAGGHVLRDLPDRLKEVALRHPKLHIQVGVALGSVPSVIDAMAQACLQDLAQGTPSSDSVDESVQKALDSR